MVEKTTLPLHTDHPRTYHDCRYVYPVLSRRSKGISLGINLNPDKICNFDCIYCQVDRRSEAETDFVATDRLMHELELVLDLVVSGKLYDDERFSQVPPELRRLNDFAFSGDGEPTTFRNFDEIIQQVADLKSARGLDDVKLVLITNASMFHRPVIERGLEILDRNNGEIWAKLDAGTDEYFQLIERTKIPFRQILDNITNAARIRPIIIQSLFMNVHGNPPNSHEIDEFCRRLNEISSAGGTISLAQVYTVARQPAEGFVTSLSDEQVDNIAEKVRTTTGIATESYYGV
ncbi:MAG: radical SAM protein [Planctomycetota bacterium]|nr:radical SAM protein [Planctomycetota bacterium]MDA1214222.1 radical SAM protein [Planctomycetota bacterium]